MKKFNEFLTSKGITTEDFAKKTEKEMADLYNEFVETQMAEINKNLNDKVSKSEISAEAKKAVNEILKDSDITKEVVRIATELKEVKESPKKPKQSKGGLMAAIKAAFEANADAIKTIVANNGKQNGPLVIEVKAAVDMSVENTIGAGDTQVSITDNTGIISPIRQRMEKYLAVVSVGSTTGNRAMWIEETDEQGTPIFIGEGDAKTKLSVKYIEKTENVKKIPVYGKVTTEMLADLPQLISYIKNNLLKRGQLATEVQLITGDGIGDNLKGTKTVATAFDAGSAAGTIVSANEFDVINAIATQVEIANGVPNAIFIHPRTIQKMKAIKSTTGEPLWKQYVDMFGDMVIAGMKVISTTAITDGEFLGGDMKAAQVLFRENWTIQIGLDGNDFINNKKTMLIEQRLVQFVSANDTPCIVKGDFATAITALTI